MSGSMSCARSRARKRSISPRSRPIWPLSSACLAGPAMTMALSDEVVNAVPDQPEAEYQGHDDDDLVGMGIDPVPQPGEEFLRWLGAEAGVDLHREDRGCGDDAEQRKREVVLPG